jgi:hypothetical protein
LLGNGSVNTSPWQLTSTSNNRRAVGSGVFSGVCSGAIQGEPTGALSLNLYIFTNNGQTMTMTNDRPNLSSEGAPIIDKTILVNVKRNKYQVVRPSWALKPGLTD